MTEKSNKPEPGFNRILRLQDVRTKTGLSRTGIYERMRDGGFPHPVNLGGRAVGWVEQEVEEWITSRIQKRR